MTLGAAVVVFADGFAGATAVRAGLVWGLRPGGEDSAPWDAVVAASVATVCAGVASTKQQSTIPTQTGAKVIDDKGRSLSGGRMGIVFKANGPILDDDTLQRSAWTVNRLKALEGPERTHRGVYAADDFLP